VKHLQSLARLPATDEEDVPPFAGDGRLAERGAHPPGGGDHLLAVDPEVVDDPLADGG
jgi:hypothetical protein